MKTLNLIKTFLAEEDGAETVEWVIIAAIMAAVAVLAYNGTLGPAVNSTIAKIVTRLGSVG